CSFAADAVAVVVEPVDVLADDSHGASDIGWPISAAAGAVDVAGDGHAGTRVVRVASLGFLGAYGDDFADRLLGNDLADQLPVGLYTVGVRHLVGEGLDSLDTL